MNEAIRLSIKSVKDGGGPFGAVIVKNGKIIAKASNSVTKDNDPTAHAEVNALRLAAKKIKNFDLNGCIVYSSCEPCPMCLAAIYWAKIDRLFFANTKTDAKKIGFDDFFIYDELELPYEKRKMKVTQMMRNKALEAFRNWDNKEDKIQY
ncbi:MAG: nucleoside deaminase [Bacteroidia bacterium]|nr:nucleoside deaminase [Bacteroidia bacterium]